MSLFALVLITTTVVVVAVVTASFVAGKVRRQRTLAQHARRLVVGIKDMFWGETWRWVDKDGAHAHHVLGIFGRIYHYHKGPGPKTNIRKRSYRRGCLNLWWGLVCDLGFGGQSANAIFAKLEERFIPAREPDEPPVFSNWLEYHKSRG